MSKVLLINGVWSVFVRGMLVSTSVLYGAKSNSMAYQASARSEMDASAR